MPRLNPYTPELASLIASTSYPPLVPPVAELESLQSTLRILAIPPGDERDLQIKRVRKEKKRKEREELEEKERERAALEANERVGARLEMVERQKIARKMTGSPAAPAPGVKVKRERSLSPAASVASSQSFRPPPVTYAAHQKKKKRLIGDSDDETPLASAHQPQTGGLKLKLSSTAAATRPDPSPTPSSSAINIHAPGGNIDFSLPPPPARPLIPLRPGVQKPMKPGPKRQADVDEDFSERKAPNQVAFTTFWSGVEPYIRDIREDDLAMLGFKADAPESYDIPPRGRHYTEVWEEEDGTVTPRYPVPNLRQPPAQVPQHFAPSELRDEQLVEEHRGLGRFTERLIAAVLGRRIGEKEKPANPPPPETSESERKDAVRVDVAQLEDGVKKELKGVMLLGEHDELDPSNREDDEITSSLRQCQRLLLQQTAINDARKARLASIAKHRLAYSEYQTHLEELEKQIEAGWAKRVKKYGLKRNNPNNLPPPVPEGLRKLVKTRKEWIEKIGRVMRARPVGEVRGLPTRSIYDGIGEDGEGGAGMGAGDEDEQVVEEGLEVESMDVDEVEGVA